MNLITIFVIVFTCINAQQADQGASVEKIVVDQKVDQDVSEEDVLNKEEIEELMRKLNKKPEEKTLPKKKGALDFLRKHECPKIANE